MNETAQSWLREYATLALRINHLVTEKDGGTVLIYRGPDELRAAAENEERPPPGRLVDDADRLLGTIPFDQSRAAFLAAQVRSMRAVARHLDGAVEPFAAYARQCLGVDVAWVPETVFEAAHAQLDPTLPRTAGTLADRLHAWQAAHSLAPDRRERLPSLIMKAVAETRARTNAIVPLPPDETVDCQVIPSAHFLAAGHYDGDKRSTIYVNGSVPFNLADLLYVVAHEGHPGHIAESLLKEIHLLNEQGRLEQQVRFMVSPSFVISEGLGLHAEGLIFAGDEAQAWLTDNVLAEEGIAPDGSDFAAIHEARNVLWGVWGNAAFMMAEGRSETEIGAYIARWALLAEAEIASALGVLKAPGMGVYVLGYYHGWRILRPWLDAPDRPQRVRHLLTEQLLSDDLLAA